MNQVPTAAFEHACARIVLVPQLHLYVPESLAEIIKRRAEDRRQSVSRYLAELVRTEISDDWEESFFEEVLGGWIGELERPEALEQETRDPLV